jgi:hypothetical protein
MAGTFAISLFRSPSLLDTERQTEIANLKNQHAIEVKQLNTALAAEKDLHRAIEKDMRVQLAEPKIVPEILEYQFQEMQRQVGLLEMGVDPLFGGAVDTIVKLYIRLGNEHRPPATVQGCQLVIYERNTWYPLHPKEERIFEIQNYTRIDLGSPIAFACPRFGWLFYRVERKNVVDLISGRLQLSVTDGTGKSISAPQKTIT